MFLLCGHLAHGVSSVFQSLGIMTVSWRGKLEVVAKAYAWIIFLGFSIVPLVVTGQKFGFFIFFDNTIFNAALALH
jgi:succinate dehydrogenase / fumarate reductase cytochrome b subunit